MSDLETVNCWNCGKKIVLPRVSPCRNSKQITGIWLSSMNEELEEKTIGGLCVDCAFKLCDDGKVSLGFSGGRLGDLEKWDAILRLEG